jgi:outer membrane protein assembly factor BamB
MTRWLHRKPVVWVALLLFPPLGILLLFTGGEIRGFSRATATAAGLFFALLHLIFFWGLRFQPDGTGIWPMPYFDRRNSHYAEIERRAEQDRAVIAKEEPAAAQPVPPAPAAAATPEAVKLATAPWPGFYGPARDGRYAGTILTAWPARGLPEVWKRPVGGGYASMIVADGKVFTIEQRRDQEALAAYTFASGREVWTSAWKASFKESMGGDGPRATPAWDEGRVYVLGAEGEFRCVDGRTGAVIWRRNILEDNGASNLQWGMAASPLIVDDMVVVAPGGSGGRSIVAYDKKTGERIWGALDDRGAYTAPMLAKLAGKRQIVAVTAVRAVGLNVEDGKLLWEFPWRTEYDVNSALPIVVDDRRLILTAGYGHGAALVEITAQGETMSARQVWASQAMKCKFNNAVLHQGVVYGLDEGILAAMDVETGQRKWKGGRYGYGQLLLAGEHLVVSTETGDVALVRATPERHEEIAKFSAIEGKTWNVPAIADGFLLVRNTTEMACYRIAP